jgi:hypothetical protein
LPDPSRSDLGILFPDARAVVPLGNGATGTQLVETLQLEPSPAVSGTVIDTDNLRVRGARVYACVVDALFGYLTPCLPQPVLTAHDGSFTLRGLPVSLGAHLYLGLLVLHPYYQPGLLPIPLPGSAGFANQNRQITLQWIRDAHLVDMPPNQRIEIWEEAAGAPPGTVIRSYSVETDAAGRERGTLKLGNGNKYLRLVAGGRDMLRQLVPVQGFGLWSEPVWRPGGDPIEMSRVVRQLEPATPDFLLSKDFRHQRFTHSTGPWMFSVLDRASGQPITAVQVFAVGGGSRRGPVSARFLGFYNAGLPLPATFERDEFELVAVGADGSLAVTPFDSFAPPTHLWLRAEGPGTVGIGPGSPLLPADGSTLTLRFQSTVANAVTRPAFVSFASPESRWEAGGLPAGSYRLEIGSQSPLSLQVQPGTLRVVR